MPVPTLTAVALTPPSDPPRPLLVLGPSLGTAVATLWSEVASLLAGSHDVIGWDLPGHGRSATTTEPFSLAELAAAVLALVDAVLAERGETGTPFAYAGDSVGGATGLQLALDAPARLTGLGVVCSSARFGDEAMWRERASLVRGSGTPVMVSGSAQRWFAPGFLERRPEVGSALLHDLRSADDDSYALVSEALATFDVRDRLGEIAVPTLVLSGALDQAAPPAQGRLVADGVARGRFVEIGGIAHQAPVEAAERTAGLLEGFFGAVAPTPGAPAAAGGDPAYEKGMVVRREVLGAAHVDRATAAVDDTTRDFQDLVTRYAWGEIWTRPGLDRRARSMVTLTALVAHGHGEELALHVRGAVTNGLSRAEIAEVLLQTAVYCGVPAANSAFRVAQEVFRALDAEVTP